MLVIYADDELSKDYSLANFHSYYDEKRKLDDKIKKLNRDNSKLKKENNHFKSTKAYRFWQFYANLKEKLF